MQIETILSCVGEIALKFLKITLPQNIQFFDNYIIITDSKDIKTQTFCKDLNLTVLVTDSFYRNGAKFNRGAAYNEAFRLLKYKDRVCILDADSYITNKLGKVIQNKDFEKNFMYGSRRIIVPKYNDFLRLLSGDKELENSLECCFGFCFGYFVLFDLNAESIKNNGLYYPDSYDSSESDWKFHNHYFGFANLDGQSYIGNMKEINERIWHLGKPNIESGESFFV